MDWIFKIGSKRLNIMTLLGFCCYSAPRVFTVRYNSLIFSHKIVTSEKLTIWQKWRFRLRFGNASFLCSFTHNAKQAAQYSKQGLQFSKQAQYKLWLKLNQRFFVNDLSRHASHFSLLVFYCNVCIRMHLTQKGSHPFSFSLYIFM